MEISGNAVNNFLNPLVTGKGLYNNFGVCKLNLKRVKNRTHVDVYMHRKWNKLSDVVSAQSLHSSKEKLDNCRYGDRATLA